MNTYHIELTKTIVVEVEAATEDEARSQAGDPRLTWDGTWDLAEPQVVVLAVYGPEEESP